ncbi:acetylxylan esterase, partial [Turicibacter sanguinis]
NKCVAKDPFLADFKRVWEMDLDSLMYEGLRYYFRWFDPLHEREDEVFSRLGYLDVVHFAKQLNCKFLLGTGLLDSSCPPSTQYAIFNQAMCNKMHLVFAKFDHELCNRFEDEVLRFIQFEEGCV